MWRKISDEVAISTRIFFSCHSSFSFHYFNEDRYANAKKRSSVNNEKKHEQWKNDDGNKNCGWMNAICIWIKFERANKKANRMLIYYRKWWISRLTHSHSAYSVDLKASLLSAVKNGFDFSGSGNSHRLDLVCVNKLFCHIGWAQMGLNANGTLPWLMWK